MTDLLNRVHFGDAYALMQSWPADLVDCTVTSVPYWQQRKYLPDGHALQRFEMGTESTIDKYLDDMAEVFAQVYRLTKPTGTLFLNVGDKFASRDTRKLCPDYHEGELLGIPWRLAERLRQVGWRRIEEIIWWKTNGNPEAAQKRVTLAHEHVFLFAKGPHHFFDPYPIQEPADYPHKPRGGQGDPADGRQPGASQLMRRARSVWPIPTVNLDGRKLVSDFKEDGTYRLRDAACPSHGDDPQVPAGPLFFATPGAGAREADCTCKEVTEDFFAAMPPLLAERCILAGTSEAGSCPECGAPIERVVEKNRVATRTGNGAKVDMSGKCRRDPKRHVTFTDTIGWRASCSHTPRQPQPTVVFDPFAGSGTTAMVACATGRQYLACELSPANFKLALARIAQGWERSPIR